MANSKSNSDRKRFWFQNYISVGSSKEFHTRSANILENRELVSGLTIDQDLRWSLLKKICSFHYDDKLTKKLLNNELKKDKSKFGADNALACEAAHPDPVTKSKWMSILVAPSKEYSASTLRTIMYTIFPIHQKNLQIPFVEFFYNNIENNKIGGDENYLETYSEMMAPQFCTEENKHILKKFLSHSKKIPATVRKNLEINLEAEEDCILVRKSDI
jgi:aminopeptidase N